MLDFVIAGPPGTTGAVQRRIRALGLMHSIMKAHAGTPCERKSRFTFSAFRADKSAALASEQPAFRVIAQELHRLQAKLACHHGHTAFSEEKFHFRGPRAISIEIRVPVKAINRVRQKRVARIFSSYVPASTFNDLSRVTKFESCLANFARHRV
jgi:hypothetical protein